MEGLGWLPERERFQDLRSFSRCFWWLCGPGAGPGAGPGRGGAGCSHPCAWVLGWRRPRLGWGGAGHSHIRRDPYRYCQTI